MKFVVLILVIVVVSVPFALIKVRTRRDRLDAMARLAAEPASSQSPTAELFRSEGVPVPDGLEP